MNTPLDVLLLLSSRVTAPALTTRSGGVYVARVRARLREKKNNVVVTQFGRSISAVQ